MITIIIINIQDENTVDPLKLKSNLFRIQITSQFCLQP